MRKLLFGLLLLALPMAATAQDRGLGVALILGVERYERLDRVRGASQVTDFAEKLSQRGFQTIAIPNPRMPAAHQAMAEFEAAALNNPDKLLVVLAGRFATDGVRNWLLTADAPELPTLTGLRDYAVPLDSLERMMRNHHGDGLMLLGMQEETIERYSPWLRSGLSALIETPQGVTILRGEVGPIRDFLEDDLLDPADTIGRLVRRNDRLRAFGFFPDDYVFPISATGLNAPPVGINVPNTLQAETEAEQALWEGAVALDTVDAYRNYLRRYPRGAFAPEAETAIEAILSEPNREARLAEEALTLDRDQRRQIQRDLSILDYDTRGIDGIFGPGTRSAITNWQQVNGFSQTSYLTIDQISRLDAQAARRAAQIEAEAEQQRRIAEARDRAFWAETGAQGDELGLRTYLERFPDGLYVQEARQQLATIEDDKRARAAAEDTAAWERVRRTDSPDAYRQYLANFPQGAFRREAEARLAALTETAADTAEIAALAEREDALGLNGLTLRLIEARLDSLGLQPGQVDGRVDENTRRALRLYQRDRNLQGSGYLDEPTIIRLLADGLDALR